MLKLGIPQAMCGLAGRQPSDTTSSRAHVRWLLPALGSPRETSAVPCRSVGVGSLEDAHLEKRLDTGEENAAVLSHLHFHYESLKMKRGFILPRL